MGLRLLFILVILGDNVLFSSGDADTSIFTPGDPRLCLKTGDETLRRFAILPGRGWDNLRNKESGRIIETNFFKCRTTNGGKFLIPDEVDTIPLKSSRVETYAELFDHWSNYTSSTSRSINSNAGLKIGHFGLSGKFSSEFENVKKHQVEDRAFTTRVQLRHSKYSVELQPNPPLNKAFRDRLHSIATHILFNNSENAYYESQLLVRDYGTHIVTSAELGASLSQEDHIKSSFTSDDNVTKSDAKAAASAAFMTVAHIGINHTHMASKQMVDQYIGNRTHSTIVTSGGPLLHLSNTTASDWQNGIDDDLVALDVSGDPIYYLITPYLFPEIPPATVYQIMTVVQSAVELYYKFNAYRGCTSRDSPNFSYQANVDDGTCQAASTNFTFGGVYQTCNMGNSGAGDLCSNVGQKNPLTGDYSCPNGYTPVLLHEGKLSKTESIKKCHRCKIFSHCCHNKKIISTASYSSYWCYARKPPGEQSGFLFGGIYTTTVSNPLTHSHACPMYFYPLRMNSNMYVCVSDDYEHGFKLSVPFAGFYSCSAGNPLAVGNRDLSHATQISQVESFLRAEGSGVWPRACPYGYSQHLATVDQSCEVNYCVKASAFSDRGLPRIRRPPFIPTPPSGHDDTAQVIIGPKGLDWTYLTDATQSNGPLSNSLNTDSTITISHGAIVGISVMAALICIIAVSVAIVLHRRRQIKRVSKERTVGTTREEDVNNGVQHIAGRSSRPSDVTSDTLGVFKQEHM